MATLNFKHLRYFWMVAKSGSIAQASARLHVTPQSISTQIAELEAALDLRLFHRVGRGLQLTDAGRRIVGYADNIFELEEELLATARNGDPAVSLPFKVGIADSVPKSLSHRVLEPVLHMDGSVRLICREGRLDSLLGDLSVNRLDMVIADRPMPADIKVRAFNHLLGTSDLTVFGATRLLRTATGSFPLMLDNAPFLMPGAEVAIRSALERWFEDQRIAPRIVGEFDDGALMKAFAQGGAGFFVAPSALSNYVCHQYSVRAVGRIETIKEQLYAITTERRMQHPAAVLVRDAASRDVFGGAARGATSTAIRRRRENARRR
jgi:LysR family transcriptional activator of nhaA